MNGRWADDPMRRGSNIAGWLDWMDGLAGWIERGEEAPSVPFGLLGAGVEAEDLDDSERIFIKSVKPGGTAEAGGLKVGDVLTSWNGKELDQVATLMRLWRSSPAGTKVRLGVKRGTAAVEVVLAPMG